MTSSIRKMLSVSSQQPGGARDKIDPEELSCSSDRKTLMFQVSLKPGTKVEVRFQGDQVRGSPFINQPSAAAVDLSRYVEGLDEAEARAGLGRTELLYDLGRTVADVENNLLDPPNTEVGKKAAIKAESTGMIKKKDPSTTPKPSSAQVVDLSSDSSDPASAPRLVFSAGIRWSKVGCIDSKDIDG